MAVAPFDAQQAKKHQQAWADHLGVPVETTNSIGMKLVLIPPGEFQMGSPQEEIAQLLESETHELSLDRLRSEGPRHRVRLTPPFYLAMCEVTQEEYEQVMGSNPSHFSSAGDGTDKMAGRSTSRHPVERVSWLNAVDFCNKLSVREKRRPCYVIEGENVTVVEGDGYRLPTEAEWEYACRSGSAGKYCFGDDESKLGQYAWYGANSAAMTHPVGEKARNGFSLHDMHGNVYEWCHDWYDEDYYDRFKSQIAVDPAGLDEGLHRVLRGGGWYFYGGRDCRSAHRIWASLPPYRNLYWGFRVALIAAGEKRISEVPKERQERLTSPKPSKRVAASPAPSSSPPMAVAPFDAQQAKKHQQVWADYLGLPVETTNSIGMMFVLIPPGEFEMGSSPEVITGQKRASAPHGWQAAHVPAEGPIHHVRITKPFYLQVCPVTQEAYLHVMGHNPARFKGDPKQPVESVSWDHAADFCLRLSNLPEEIAVGRSYRLPTEAEWEYACRAGSATRWHFGDDQRKLAEYGWCAGSGGKPHPVGQLKANPWGLYDMYGNVSNWCADRYDKNYYRNSPTDDPAGRAEGGDRVIRGGGWRDWAGFSRSAYRLFRPHGYSVDDELGFRVATGVSGN